MAKFICEYCGQEFSTAQQLLGSTCQKHPLGAYKGKHKLYEGGEKSKYTCKYCGKEFSSIRQMVGTTCQRHPDGAYKGKHAPSLV